MLRSLVLILLLLNLAFFSWTQGWLTSVVGMSPSQEREPQRLSLQRHADQLEVIPPGVLPSASAASAALVQAIASAAAEGSSDAASSPDLAIASGASAASASSSAASATTTAAAGPTSCLKAGPFGSMEMGIVTTSIKPILADNAWRTEEVTLTGLWFVYMGPYPDRELFNRKQAELKALGGISFREVRTPTSLANGFVLGRYEQPDEAQAALNKLKERGVRSARVVVVRPRMQAQNVIVPQATAAIQTSLNGIRLPEGKRFANCP